jgi:DNA-binding MarR family transcriptional regulator
MAKVPGHAGQQQAHPAGVADSGEHQTGADEGRQAVTGWIGVDFDLTTVVRVRTILAELNMVSGHDIAMALRAAYWAMHRQADALLQPHGVTANQFVLMSILAEGKVLTQQELVRRASSDANTVRAMLVLLERSGLVSRRPHQADGRVRCVALTDKGRSTYAALWAQSQAFHERLLAAIGPDSAPAFVQQLRSLENMTAPKHDRHHDGEACRQSRHSQSSRSSSRSSVP